MLRSLCQARCVPYVTPTGSSLICALLAHTILGLVPVLHAVPHHHYTQSMLQGAALKRCKDEACFFLGGHGMVAEAVGPLEEPQGHQQVSFMKLALDFEAFTTSPAP